jgi:hypothetical protein
VHVFGPHGDRLEGAAVRVELDAVPLDLSRRTGNDGRAVFPALPAGLGHRIEIAAEGYVTHVQRLVPVTSSGEVHLSIRLGEPSATDVDPLTGQELRAVDPAPGERPHLLAVCPAGRFPRCPGGPCRCALDNNAGAIEITVLGPDGAPLAGALVSATTVNTACTTSTTSDESGRGHLEGLAAGAACDVEIVGGLLSAVARITPERRALSKRVVRLSYPEGSLATAVDSCTIPLPRETFSFDADDARGQRAPLASAFIELTAPDRQILFPRSWTAPF